MFSIINNQKIYIREKNYSFTATWSKKAIFTIGGVDHKLQTKIRIFRERVTSVFILK